MLLSANLLEVAAVRRLSGAVAAGTTTITGTTKMDGYDGVMFVASLSGIVNGAQPVLTVQQGALANGSDAANLKDPAGNVIQTNAVTLTGAPATGTLVADAVRFSKEYATFSLARATQNVAVDSVYAILYRSKKVPVVLDSTILASVNAPGT